MTTTRSDILDTIEHLDNAVMKQNLTTVLWDFVREQGSPRIEKQSADNYEATFLYQSNDPSLHLTLKSEDLYDRMLDKHGKLREFTHIPNTDIYYLKVSNIPSKVCVEYAILSHEHEISDVLNKNNAMIKRYDATSNSIISIKACYLKTDHADIPRLISNDDHYEISKKKFHSEKSTFTDRDIYLYKPENFDPKTGKVVFMLDGKEFCELMTPYLSAAAKNTAYVFVDSSTTECSEPGGYEYKTFNYKPFNFPDEKRLDFKDRIYEFYFKKDDFAEMLTNELIPQYCETLGITNNDNVILAAHSLAVHPILEIASKHSSDIGGVILISPAINKNLPDSLPDMPDERLASLPIYMQVGQLENIEPSQAVANQTDTRAISLLDANNSFHTRLRSASYTIDNLNVHSGGHAGIHALQGLERGLNFIDEHKPVKEVTHTHRIIE